jgi:hypothetical protein
VFLLIEKELDALYECGYNHPVFENW